MDWVSGISRPVPVLRAVLWGGKVAAVETPDGGYGLVAGRCDGT